MTILETRPGKPFGYANSISNRQGIYLLVCLIGILLPSCVTLESRLQYSYLPETYLLGTAPSGYFLSNDSLKVVLLNNNALSNANVIHLWKSDVYTRLINKEHPYVRISGWDISVIKDCLDRLFDIYYIASTSDTLSPMDQFGSLDGDSDRCQPLSNHEIQFMMNSGAEYAFPKVPFTMLVISAHELLLEKGATPIYPRIVSPFLRQKFNLPEYDPIYTANLFAQKTAASIMIAKKQGFVFCRKGKQLF